MKISIAMATFNGEAYLREQLDSLAAQTRIPDELVVTDDGSNDGTIAILERFAASVPFDVQIHRNDSNLGFAKNFERALSLCTGDIIFLCDQDDVWDPNKVERVTFEFRSHPEVMMVINDARLVDQRMRWFGHTQLSVIRRAGVGHHAFITGCCSALRRAFLNLMLPIGEKVEHDLWLNRAAHAAGVSLVIAEPLQSFRRHGLNNSNWPMSAAQQGSLDAVTSHLHPSEFGPKAAWNYQRRILDAVASRIECRISQGVAGRWEQRWLNSVCNERDSYTARLALLDRSRLRRAAAIWRMLREGRYRHFTGLKSAIKDFVRP